jgi:hypothetical protein
MLLLLGFGAVVTVVALADTVEEEEEVGMEEEEEVGMKEGEEREEEREEENRDSAMCCATTRSASFLRVHSAFAICCSTCSPPPNTTETSQLSPLSLVVNVGGNRPRCCSNSCKRPRQLISLIISFSIQETEIYIARYAAKLAEMKEKNDIQ